MQYSDSRTAAPDFERGLAIVIGINAYTQGIPPLLNAVRDAQAVADRLEGQGFEVLRLLDEAATLASLSELLTRHLPSLQPPPDRLLIYFAGHGLAHTDDQHRISGFLLSADARREDPSSYWPMASLRQALGALSCRHLLLMLDCCFAGAFPHSVSRDVRAPDTPAPLFLERFRHFSSRRSFQLLLSTAHDELASDRLLSKPSQESLGDGRHSPFALALLEALQFPSPADTNQDGLLTASELSTFLRDRLIDLLPPHGQQTPTLWPLDWHDSGEFLFLLSESFPSLPLAAPLSRRSNPYLGLRPFSSAHRHLFFGRERLVDALIEHLRTHPLLLLCGPSGIGKSSIVHAALLPRLNDDPSWRVPPSLRPGTQPLAALSAWLASLRPGSPSPSARSLLAQPHAAAECVRAFLSQDGDRSLLLVIDPLEELVTTCPDGAQRQAFLQAVSGLLQLAHPQLRLLWLLRADFEPHFLTLLPPSGLTSEQWHANRRPLPPMNRDELRRCIEKPAEACVLFFEPGLIEHLLDDVEQMPGALPLLSVALSQLFDGYLASGRSDRTLTFEDYRRLGGGIAGALQRQAELIFSGAASLLSAEYAPLPPLRPGELRAFQRTLRNVLMRMVSLEGGELARRRVPRAELDYGHPEENERVQRVLRTLEGSRLVVASDDGGPCVEPAHDALLSAWPRLHDWARHASRELLLLRRVSHAAAEWLRHRQSRDFLWADGRLAQLGLTPGSLRRAEIPLTLSTVSPESQSHTALGFNASESGFLRASARQRRWLSTLRTAIGCTVVGTLMLLTALALLQSRQARANAQKALEQQELARQNAEEARRQTKLVAINARLSNARALINENPTQAMLILREIEKGDEVSEKEWLQSALQISHRLITNVVFSGHTNDIMGISYSPDGLLILTTSLDETARLWRADGMGEPRILEGHRDSVSSATFSPDGSLILTASQDGTARLWSVDDTNKPLRVFTGDNVSNEDNSSEDIANEDIPDVTVAKFSPDGSHILTANEDGFVYLWKTQKLNQQPLALVGHQDTVNAAHFSLDGKHILTASNDGTARVWNLKGDELYTLTHKKAVSCAAFSPNGKSVLTGSADHIVRLWTLGRKQPRSFQGHSEHLNSIRFSPDGYFFLTASDDNTARLWDLARHGAPPLVLSGHSQEVTSAMFSPNGNLILTSSADRTARLWRTDGKEAPLTLSGHTDSVGAAIFSPDGSSILTASDDDTARLWRIQGAGIPFLVQERSDISPALSPDGARVLTSSGSTLQLFSLDGSGRQLASFNHDDTVDAGEFSPDGSSILSISESDNENAHIWQVGNTDHLPSETRVGKKGTTTSALFSPDGSSILTLSSGRTDHPYLWQAAHPNALIRELAGHSGAVFLAVFSPDSKALVTGSKDDTVRLWRLDQDGSSSVLGGHQGQARSAAFSPDGALVVVGSNYGVAHLWDISDVKAPLRVFTGAHAPLTSITFSPNGASIVAASSDGTASVWRTDGTGDRLVLKGHKDAVLSAQFTPDGSHILTASNDGTARLWPLNGKTTPLILQHEEALNPLADVHALLTPDSSRVVTACVDGLIRVWPLKPEPLREYFQKATTVCLTALEREMYLFEKPATAREAHARCEQSNDRSL